MERKRQKSAIIAVDVRRFGHAINTDKVFGTHTGGQFYVENLPAPAASSAQEMRELRTTKGATFVLGRRLISER